MTAVCVVEDRSVVGGGRVGVCFCGWVVVNMCLSLSHFLSSLSLSIYLYLSISLSLHLSLYLSIYLPLSLSTSSYLSLTLALFLFLPALCLSF